MMSLFLFNCIYCHVTMIVEYIYYANISKFQRRNFNTVCLFFDVSSDFQRRSIGKLYSNCCVVNYIQCFVCSLPFLTSLIFQISSVEQCYRTYFVVSSNMLSCFHPFLYLFCYTSSLPPYLPSEPIFLSSWSCRSDICPQSLSASLFPFIPSYSLSSLVLLLIHRIHVALITAIHLDNK